MLIQAVIEPPEEAREHLRVALSRHLGDERVQWFQPEDWRVRVATFGYLAFGDMTKLEDTMIHRVDRMPSMQLRMRTIVPLPEDSDDSIWVDLGGDVDELATLAQEIPGWVHGLGYLLDRYSFRPRVRLARVSSRTTVEYLEELISEVGSYSGPEWRADAIQIVRRKPDGTPGSLYRTHSSLPLGAAFASVRVGADAAASAPAEPALGRLPLPRGGEGNPA